MVVRADGGIVEQITVTSNVGPSGFTFMSGEDTAGVSNLSSESLKKKKQVAEYLLRVSAFQ